MEVGDIFSGLAAAKSWYLSIRPGRAEQSRAESTSTLKTEPQVSSSTVAPSSGGEIKMSSSLAPECSEVKEYVYIPPRSSQTGVKLIVSQALRQLFPEMVQRE
jgi:hypothetical protein